MRCSREEDDFFCAQNHARYNSQKKKKRGTNNYDVFKNAFLTNW